MNLLKNRDRRARSLTKSCIPCDPFECAEFSVKIYASVQDLSDSFDIVAADAHCTRTDRITYCMYIYRGRYAVNLIRKIKNNKKINKKEKENGTRYILLDRGRVRPLLSRGSINRRRVGGGLPCRRIGNDLNSSGVHRYTCAFVYVRIFSPMPCEVSELDVMCVNYIKA